MLERIQIGLYLSRDVQIRNPRTQRSFDHGRRPAGEGAGAIDVRKDRKLPVLSLP
jgi:hypothetical protein